MVKDGFVKVSFVFLLLSACVGAALENADWESSPPHGVPPDNRYGYACGYMASTNKLLYFGGANLQTYFNDLLTFDLTTHKWRLAPVVSSFPSRRTYVAGIIQNNEFYIFGGTDDVGTGMDDMWRYTFSTNSWKQLTSSSRTLPVARYRARLFTIDSQPGMIYLHGGIAPGFKLQDFWQFDINTYRWQAVSVPGWNNSLQSDLYDGVVTTLTNNSVAIVVGPVQALNVYVLTFTNATAATVTFVPVTTPTRPNARYIFALSSVGQLLYLHCGWNDAASNNWIDLWTFNLATGVWYSVPLSTSSRRDSLTAVAVPTSSTTADIWYFGGWGDTIVNDLYVLSANPTCATDGSTCSFKQYHEESLQPPAVAGHSAVRIGSEMVVFGGQTSAGVSNLLWMYSFSGKVWRTVGSDATFPSPRAYHTAVNIGIRMLVFGGKSSTGIPNNEVWEYNTAVVDTTTTAIVPKWRQLISIGVQPSIRWGHSSAVAGTLDAPLMVVFGGVSITDQLFDMWLFDPQTNVWTEVKLSSDDGLPTDTRNGRMAYYAPNVLLVLGGIDANGFPSNQTYMVALSPYPDQGPPTGRFTTIDNAQLPSEVFNQAMTVLDGNLIVHAGQWYELLRNTTSLIPFSDGSFLVNPPAVTVRAVGSSSTNSPSYRGAHTMIAFGASVVVFGGVGSVAETNNIAVKTVLFNEVYELNFTVCSPTADMSTPSYQRGCIVCSPGTYLSGSACLPCEAGTYRNVSATQFVGCDPCPKGFYNPVEGSDSNLHCLPCSVGYYAPTEGSATCTKCTDGTACTTLGSTAALQAGATGQSSTGDDLKLTQPNQIVDKQKLETTVIKYQNLLGYITAGVLGVIILLFLFSVKCCGGFNCLKLAWRKLDLLYSLKHSQYADYGEPVLKMKTVIGGLFTSLAVVLVIWNSGTVLLPLAVANTAFSRSLVSNLLLYDVAVSGNVTITVVLNNYLARCEVEGSDAAHSCPPLTTVASTTILGNQSLTCSSLTASTCQVQWTCTGCNFTRNQVSSLFTFNEPNTAVGFFSWAVATSAGLVQQTSTIQGSLRAPDNYVFRGLNAYSQVSLRATPVVYQALTNSTNSTGWLLNYVSQYPGSTVDPSTFYSAQGAALQFNFEAQEVTMEVAVDTTLKPELLAAVVVGAAGAVLGLVSVLMGRVEALITPGALEPEEWYTDTKSGEKSDAGEHAGGKKSDDSDKDIYKRDRAGSKNNSHKDAGNEMHVMYGHHPEERERERAQTADV